MDCVFALFVVFVIFDVVLFALSFRVHVYNKEDLILCALPYHDTQTFVRIVQIIDTRLGRYDYLLLCLVLMWITGWKGF